VVVIAVLVVVVDVVVVVVVVVGAETDCIMTRMLFEAVNPLASVAVTVMTCSPSSRNVKSGLFPVAVFCVLGPSVFQVRAIGCVPPEDTALNVVPDV
jgi:hypothetical protein